MRTLVSNYMQRIRTACPPRHVLEYRQWILFPKYERTFGFQNILADVPTISVTSILLY
jgi:hypothetical protein